MYYLIYVSSASPKLTPPDLETLLERARKRNTELGITGMLIHRSGNFIQYIEGERDKVKSLYATICADPRHSGAILIGEGEIKARQFGDWAMDLRTPGNKPIFSDEELADDPEGVKTILHSFVSNMR